MYINYNINLVWRKNWYISLKIPPGETEIKINQERSITCTAYTTLKFEMRNSFFKKIQHFSESCICFRAPFRSTSSAWLPPYHGWVIAGHSTIMLNDQRDCQTSHHSSMLSAQSVFYSPCFAIEEIWTIIIIDIFYRQFEPQFVLAFDIYNFTWTVFMLISVVVVLNYETLYIYK